MRTDDKEPALFGEEEMVLWKAEWQNMPEYSHQDLAPEFQVVVSFTCAGDLEDFGKAIGQELKPNWKSRQTQSIWFPESEIGHFANKRYIDLGAKP